MHSRKPVHFHFADRRAIREIMKGFAPPRRPVPINAGRAIKTSSRETDAIEVSLTHDFGESKFETRRLSVPNKTPSELDLLCRHTSPNFIFQKRDRAGR